MKLYFVTSNDNKLREAEQILEKKIEKIDLDIDEIQTVDVEEVVKDKAHKAYDVVKKPVFVEDTGLYFTGMKGFPGALIKWLLQSVGTKGICKVVDGFERKAVAKASICLYDGKKYNIFTGEVKGSITENPKGSSNFGWDPVFQPKGYDKTFAEMPAEKKNKISHRKLAFMKMKEFLDKIKK